MAVNRRLVIGGLIIGGGGIVAYEIYKHQKQKAAADAATAQAADAATAASGYGYGAGAYGYGASAGAAYGYGASGGFPAGYYGYGVPEPPGGSGGGAVPPPVASTTNAQWDQAAITQLQQDGYESATVAAALGAYLNGQEVNSSQVNIIDAAIGIEGYPPVAASSGYPPAIKQGGTPGGGSGGGQGGGKQGTVKVPSVVGERAETGEAKLHAAGFRTNERGSRVKGAAYHITAQTPKGGANAAKGATVTVTIARGK